MRNTCSIWTLLVLSHHLVLASDINRVITWNHTPGDGAILLVDPKQDYSENIQRHHQFFREKRDVIEEEKYYYPDKPKSDSENTNSKSPWIPETITEEEKLQPPTTSENLKQALPLYQTTEAPTEKPGRGARGTHDNWIKLPSPGRDEEEKDRLLIPPQPSDDLLNSRMPRVNFVTQNKRLETSETRDSVPRATINRNDDLRMDFVHAGVDSRARSLKDVFPRQALYYPEEDRRRYLYDDRYYPADDLYRRDPYDPYDRRFMDYVPYSPSSRIDRFDPAVYDNYLTRKPKRIIYYAHLPEVVRTPPSVDMRYKYSVDPYRRYDEEIRSGRYDYRFKQRYPYSALKKDDRASRDLVGSSSTKDKRTDDKDLTPPPVHKDDVRSRNKNNLNSHQYHMESSEVHYTEPLHKMYEDVVRSDQGFVRYDVPSFQDPIDDPYAERH